MEPATGMLAVLWAAAFAAAGVTAEGSRLAPSIGPGEDLAAGAVKITALGLGAVRISGGGRTVYVDAFFKSNPIDRFDGRDADVILVTHDHADHFDAGAVAAAAEVADALVVGPPSIAYPLLVTHGLPASRLRILYDQSPSTPAHTEVDGVGISSYATRHFFDGQELAIHNSYLLTLQGRRILVAGDSVALSRKAEELRLVDALLWSFVIPDKDLARVSDLEDALRSFEPKALFPVHLIDCNWTVRPADLAGEVTRRELDAVVVLDRADRSRCLDGGGVRRCP